MIPLNKTQNNEVKNNTQLSNQASSRVEQPNRSSIRLSKEGKNENKVADKKINKDDQPKDLDIRLPTIPVIRLPVQSPQVVTKRANFIPPENSRESAMSFDSFDNDQIEPIGQPESPLISHENKSTSTSFENLQQLKDNIEPISTLKTLNKAADSLEDITNRPVSNILTVPKLRNESQQLKPKRSSSFNLDSEDSEIESSQSRTQKDEIKKKSAKSDSQKDILIDKQLREIQEPKQIEPEELKQFDNELAMDTVMDNEVTIEEEDRRSDIFAID